MQNNYLFDKLRPIIIKATGVPECLYGYQNQPAVKGSYCAVAISNVRERGQANQTNKFNKPERAIDYKVRRQLIATVTVNFYRNGAMDYAQLLHQAFKLPNIQMDLLRAGVAFTGTSYVTNVTELFSGNQEERAHIELYVYFTLESDDRVNVIERGDIVVKDENDNFIAKSKFDVAINPKG